MKTKSNNKIKKNKLSKTIKNKTKIISIIIIAVIGLLMLKFMSAANYDGYQRIRIINTASREIGQKKGSAKHKLYTEGNIYENWCADFVSWVYKEAGYPFNASAEKGRSSWRISRVYIPHKTIPNLRDYLKVHNAYRTKESRYIPAPGDIVIFARNRSHTGIVERYISSSRIIITIEGNTSTNDVARRMYKLDDPTIDGYGTIINSPPKK